MQSWEKYVKYQPSKDRQLQITWHMHSPAGTVRATPEPRIFQTIVDFLSDLEMGVHSPFHVKHDNAQIEATLI